MNHRERVRRRSAGTGEPTHQRAGATSGAHGDVDVRIEQLIADGVRPGDGHRLGASLRRELGRLLAAHGVPNASITTRARDRIATEVPAWSSRAQAEHIGKTIAQAVFEALHQPAGDLHTHRSTRLGSTGYEGT